MHVLGVDGCKAGWCCVAFTDELCNVEVYEEFREILRHQSAAERILVDMPIGLGDRHIPRDVDYVARKLLAPKRRSSLFIPAVREAIEASDYASAKEMNQKITGKKISIQSWNITGKIREVDQFVIDNPLVRSSIYEAHPELCFKFLNAGKDLVFSKNAPKQQGIAERLQILRRYEILAESIVYGQKGKFSSNEVRYDDIADALCLAITARLGTLYAFQQITGSHTHDSKGIAMRLHYVNPDR